MGQGDGEMSDREKETQKNDNKAQSEAFEKEQKDIDEMEDLKKQLEEKEQELAECKDKMLRLAAELDNFKKRIDREKAEYMKYALESFAKELLPFLDNLERAVQSAKESKDIDALIEGLDLTLSGYLKTLEKFGLKTFAAEGQRFDPTFHEALTVEEDHTVDENTVIKELLRGYTLHERVLRPALVVVSKKPEQSGSQESGQNESNA